MKILDDILISQCKAIEEWFEEKYQSLSLPIYNSFDIRVSDNKICPVDANFFPAAWYRVDLNEQIIDSFKEYFSSLNIQSQKILLISEKEINNLYYNSGLSRLKYFLERTDREVVIGTVKQPVDGKIEIIDSENNRLEIFSIRIRDNILKTSNGFTPDIIIMNNDMRKLSALIKNANQKIIPTVNMGWWKRDKLRFFIIYNNLVKECADRFGINKDLLSIETTICNFNDQFSLQIKEFFQILKNIYADKPSGGEPYFVVKPAKGTYGKLVRVVATSSDIEKTISYYYNIIKNNKTLPEKFILQEGIKTIFNYNEMPAEPVIYTIGRRIVGGFWRFNKNLDYMGNLNCKNARFGSLVLDERLNFIGQLANLAATIEMNEEII